MAILLNLVKISIILDKCVHSRLRVDLGRQNAFIQSFHINTCKQHIVFLLMQHNYLLLEQWGDACCHLANKL